MNRFWFLPIHLLLRLPKPATPRSSRPIITNSSRSSRRTSRDSCGFAEGQARRRKIKRPESVVEEEEESVVRRPSSVVELGECGALGKRWCHGAGLR